MSSFDGDYGEIEKPKSKQKLTNDKSIFKDFKQNDFEDKVREIEKEKQKYKTQISKSIIKFKNIILDKTLPENKNPLSLSIDSDVLKELTELAEKMNDDKTEKEGMGTFLLCTVLLKFMLIYRDRFNSLEYKLSQLESKINKVPDLIDRRVSSIESKLDNKQQ